jgi:DUF4097 and DUF4098 domain-containing protein YvlB
MPIARAPRPVPPTCVVVLGCLGACAFAHGRMVVVGPTAELRERAGKTLRIPLDAAGATDVALVTQHGTIETTAVDAGFEVVAELELWAETQVDAARALERFELVAERTTGRCAVRLAGEPLRYERPGSSTQVWPRVRLTARIPKGSCVAATAGSGDVRLQGPFGRSEATSGHGRILLADVAGASARTSSGNIEARRVTGDVRLVSGFGAIEASDVRAGSVTVETGSGNVRLREVTAETIVATSRHGSIDVRQAAGSLVARSSSGDVAVAGFTGSVRLGSGHGAVAASGVFTALQAHSDSGRVDVDAGEGSRAAEPWRLASGHGDVELGLPAGFACELRARTAHGRIHTDLPVTLEPGDVERGSLRGVLGAGGSRVELVSSSGDVSVRKR